MATSLSNIQIWPDFCRLLIKILDILWKYEWNTTVATKKIVYCFLMTWCKGLASQPRKHFMNTQLFSGETISQTLFLRPLQHQPRLPYYVPHQPLHLCKNSDTAFEWPTPSPAYHIPGSLALGGSPKEVQLLCPAKDHYIINRGMRHW